MVSDPIASFQLHAVHKTMPHTVHTPHNTCFFYTKHISGDLYANICNEKWQVSKLNIIIHHQNSCSWHFSQIVSCVSATQIKGWWNKTKTRKINNKVLPNRMRLLNLTIKMSTTTYFTVRRCICITKIFNHQTRKVTDHRKTRHHIRVTGTWTMGPPLVWSKSDHTNSIPEMISTVMM